MLKIADIMTHGVFTVAASAPVEEVAWALAVRNIGGAPVRDGWGRLIGTVTKLELCDPARAVWTRSREVRGLLAEDVMSPHLVVARADEPVMTAVRLMSREHTRQVVVVDDEGAVVGIVTPTDVMRALVYGDQVISATDATEAQPEAPADQDASVG
jgi:CBS-domain-containing membrane protein